MDLDTYARERDALLQRITDTLASDGRVRAVWLSGSFGRGEADEWSDLDLHLAVDDERFGELLAQRPALYERVGRPLLVQEDMPSDSQRGARFQLVVYHGPIEVDWNIGAVGQAERPLAFRMLLERDHIPVAAPRPLSAEQRKQRARHWLTFFWAMAPIAVKLCGRGDTERAANQVRLLTTAFIALWRLATEPEGWDPVVSSLNRVMEPELDAIIPRLGPVIEPTGALEVVDALCREVQKLHPALATLGATINAEIPAEVFALRDLARQVLHSGPRPQRPYR
jgi:predicted nucleotidyltransferase